MCGVFISVQYNTSLEHQRVIVTEFHLVDNMRRYRVGIARESAGGEEFYGLLERLLL